MYKDIKIQWFVFCVSIVCFILSSCSATQTLDSKSFAASGYKITRLNMVYFDDLHNAKSSSTTAISNENSEARGRKFAIETRNSFAVEFLKAIPEEFKLHGIEANIALYKSKKYKGMELKGIDSSEIEKLFPNSKGDPLLVVSPTSFKIECADRCFYDLSLSSQLFELQSAKLLWSSTSKIETKLWDRVKFISTKENAKKSVHELVEKMKSDKLF